MNGSSTSPICALCEHLIASKGDSGEHIVPNSIGGHRKVWGFICRDCNSQAGNSWDAEIWRQFSNIAMLHGVKRDRGQPPSISVQTADGNRYLLLPDGSLTPEHPMFEVEQTEDETTIRITARNLEEAQRMATHAARKYPKLDLQDLLSKASVTETTLESPVTFNSSFGGELAGRSMVKSAMALATVAGVSAQACEAALAYLKNETAKPSYAFFYIRDLVANRPTTHAFNCVSVLADPMHRRLLGYVEYFSLSRIVVILSEAYDDMPVQATYAFNPADGIKLDLQVDLNLSDVELEMVRTNNATPDANYAAALDAGFGAIYRQSQSRNLERATVEAFEHACKELGIPWGGVVSPMHAQEFAEQVAKYLSPRILKMLSP